MPMPAKAPRGLCLCKIRSRFGLNDPPPVWRGSDCRRK